MGQPGQRLLGFAYIRLDGRGPQPRNPSSSSGQGLDDGDRPLPEKGEAGFETVGALYAACKCSTSSSTRRRRGRTRTWPTTTYVPWPLPNRPRFTNNAGDIDAGAAQVLGLVGGHKADLH